MPQDERKRQKTLMKKRSKQKAASHHRAQQRLIQGPVSAAILHQARSFPILECQISDNWDKKDDQGLIMVLVTRQQPDGNVCFGTYLIDKFCLGVKNTFARTNFSREHYQEEARHLFREVNPIPCPPELAHQMVYASIEYAGQFGFMPEKDFAQSQYLLAPRGELAEPYQMEFGRNGKPFFIAGPYDNARQILKQLERTAGPGNFDFVAMVSDPGLF
jgi:hypothetical protein